MRCLACIFIVSLLALVKVAAQGQPQCLQLAFTGEVKAGQTFTQEIGNELAFRVVPSDQQAPDQGWYFEIGPTSPAVDEWDQYIYVVTPPYHFRHSRDISTDYGVPAQQAVGRYLHRFWFVLSRTEGSQAAAALNNDLSPQNQTDIDHAGELRRSLPKGRGGFLVVDSKITPGKLNPESGSCEPGSCGAMHWIKFHVTLVVPQTFKATSGLQKAIAPCPGTWE